MKVHEFLKHSRQKIVSCKPTMASRLPRSLNAHNIGACRSRTAPKWSVSSERDLVRTFATMGCDLQKMRVRDLMTVN